MIIADVQLFSYSLPLRRPLRVGGRPLNERTGLIVRVRETEGGTGWGEAAPLPGFSREGFSEAVGEARNLLPRLSGVTVSMGAWTDVLGSGPAATLPSVQFALESALLDLAADTSAASVVEVLGGGASSVSVNALIDVPGEGPGETAERLVRAGYSTLKLKVGRQPVAADVALVRQLRSALDDDIALRLDANRRWTLDEALMFSEGIDARSITYIEEPLQDPEELFAFVSQSDLPVALDETTRERGPDALRQGLPVRAVVLKPTLLGGVIETHRWIRAAIAAGVTPVISASYESGVGLRMLSSMAAAFTEAPAGLSTYSRFEEDLLMPRPSFSGPTVEIDTLSRSTVRSEHLRQVDSWD